MNYRTVPSTLVLSAALVAAPASAQTKPSTSTTVDIETPAQAVADPQVPAWMVHETLALETAGSAQKLEAEGRASQAVALLDRQRGECGAGDDGRACRQIIDYSLGYVLQQSSAESEAPGSALRQAAVAYEKVLSEEPSHGPTLANLADIWQRLGEPQRAVPYLERAIAADPAAAGIYAVQLGDLRLQSGAPREARAVYSQALAQDPGNMVVCDRLVLSHELAPDASSAQELLHWGEVWERPVPEAARDAYEAAVRIAHRSDPGLSETALVRWVDLQGRSGGLSPHDLERLPTSWESPAARELRTWLKQPEEPLPRESWWRQREERSMALARVALGLGREQAGRGAPEKAEAIWRFGRELATGSEATRIDLQTELALFFFHHPELDPDGTKFRATEGEVFDAKIAAIARADRASIQRYHESLGLIYAERGNWGSRGDPHSALFQLQQAVDTAAEREYAENLYQPLPFIRERLADGYLATGATEQAGSAYLDACRAYLDLDDLRKAEMMLATARRLVTPEAREATAEIARLSEILPVRRQLAAAADPLPMPLEKYFATPPLARPALAEIEQSAWLAHSWEHPRKGFVARQRFKALADLAKAASDVRAPALDIALRHAVQAMDMALRRQAYLVGAGDLLRLQRVQALYATPIGLTLEAPRLLTAGGATTDALPIALSAGDQPAFVLISPESALAARIVEHLGAELVLSVRPYLEIRGGSVSVSVTQPGTDLDDLVAKLKAIEGVETVRVVRPFPWSG